MPAELYRRTLGRYITLGFNVEKTRHYFLIITVKGRKLNNNGVTVLTIQAGKSTLVLVIQAGEKHPSVGHPGRGKAP